MGFLAPVAAPLMAVGTLVSAFGSMNAGKSQQQAADYSAAVASQEAELAVAAGTSNVAQQYRKTQLGLESNTAKAAASGVNPGFGSPVANAGNIAKWGTYNAMMDMFNAKSQAQGLKTQAQADIYGGQQAESAGMWNAAGSIIGGATSLASKYGDISIPASSPYTPSGDKGYNPYG